MPRIGKKWSNFFLVPYIFDFIFTKWKIFHQWLLFARSGKNWNDFLYVFIFLFLFTGTEKYSTYWKWFILLPKILERQMQNAFIYFREVEKQTSFLYFYTHLILFPKMENIVPIHFFAQNTKKLIESFNLHIIYYTQTLSLSCRVKT